MNDVRENTLATARRGWALLRDLVPPEAHPLCDVLEHHHMNVIEICLAPAEAPQVDPPSGSGRAPLRLVEAVYEGRDVP